MGIPKLPLQREEVKEKPNYECENDSYENEEEVEAHHHQYNYLESIMEMPSFQERGSYSLILSKAPSVDYYDAYIFELKELSSSKALKKECLTYSQRTQARH
ncbi:unnamed protein product [Moneuplotes crassus]|uniref:Uncharacterized protein n=1 Tax=Euplotes crassus TaxID=5936 RepID=A0AAD1X8J5_EUPCR|nr:unnamed protein product [Moneuplotes crassus]